jgi:hypothetical protein
LAFAALMLTASLLSALAWVLALLILIMSAALLARLILVALVLLSALIRIISHFVGPFESYPAIWQLARSRQVPTKLLKLKMIPVP